MPPNSLNSVTVSRKINFKKLVTKSILGVFAGFVFGFVTSLVLSFVFGLSDSGPAFWTPFFVVWGLTIVIFGFFGANTKTKEEMKRLIVSEEGLVGNERIVAWVFSILNPVFAGAIMYYMWYQRYPTKAKKANEISMIMFLFYILLAVLFVNLTSK
jgi:hypothetical protein